MGPVHSKRYLCPGSQTPIEVNIAIITLDSDKNLKNMFLGDGQFLSYKKTTTGCASTMDRGTSSILMRKKRGPGKPTLWITKVSGT